MAETLKSNFEVSNGTTEVKILDGAGSGIVYTILSISICNTRSGDDETFDLFIDDVNGTYGSSGEHFYLYMTQSLPALSTFVHNDKLVLTDDDELVFVMDDNTNGTDVDIAITYLEQT